MLLAWNTYFISLITASHGGKLATFIYIPLLIYLAWQVMEKRGLLDFGLFAMVFGWQVQHGGHTQVLFYSVISVAILFVVWAIFELREGGALRAATAAGYLAVGGILAVGVGALWYIPLLEYVEYSIRGVGPALGSASQGGYSMDDATAWSMAPSELITVIFPSWYGLKSPVYWGDMLFTSSSFYFGIVPLFLAVLGILGKKSRLVWGLIALSVFSILLSFGKHFSLFYSIFFDYFPFFNKFRTPSLILLLVMMCAAILAAYGYRALDEKIGNEKWKKYLFYGAIACTVLMILSIIGGKSLATSLASFSREGEAQRYSAQQIAGLKTQRADALAQDLAIRFTFLAAALWMAYLFVVGKMKSVALLSGLTLITLIDLGSFAGKFFDPQPAAQQKALLRTNRVVDGLAQEKDVFRVFPVGRLNQDNRWAAWGVQSLGGYHGAKLRSWQDMADNVFYNGSNRQFPLNYELLGSLNCKYIITEGLLPPEFGMTLAYEDAGAKMAAYKLPTYKERAYFADSVIVIEDRARTFETMKAPGFSFMSKAIVNKALPGIAAKSADATARVTNYAAHKVEISSSNSSSGLLVLSDAYYEPEWTATVDGQPAEIFLVNGFARGVYLTAGSHSVIFEYAGHKEATGATVATVSHFLVLALVGVGFYMNRRKKSLA
ncbi:hypothetical protein IT157_04260 [bacterium]|nr:hypothetical protein [bacterium]